MQDSVLLKTTLQYLRDRPYYITIERISTATGIKVSWIKALSKGVMNDPGVTKIETLYTYFTKQAIQLIEPPKNPLG